MKSFTFRLNSLLNVRLGERDAARRGVAEAVQALQMLEKQIAEKDLQLKQLKGQRVDALQGQVSVDALLSQSRYEMLFVQEKAKLQSQVQQINTEREKREAVLRQTDQEVKRIEKLRDHALAAHRHDERMQMQAEMDEVASIQHQASGDRRYLN